VFVKVPKKDLAPRVRKWYLPRTFPKDIATPPSLQPPPSQGYDYSIDGIEEWG
jgi:hypothetical protein